MSKYQLPMPGRKHHKNTQCWVLRFHCAKTRIWDKHGTNRDRPRQKLDISLAVSTIVRIESSPDRYLSTPVASSKQMLPSFFCGEIKLAPFPPPSKSIDINPELRCLVNPSTERTALSFAWNFRCVSIVQARSGDRRRSNRVESYVLLVTLVGRLIFRIT
jgi:hypothetical protein